MKTIEDYVGNRENNFNLIRLVAAVMVLFSHSYALTGALGGEPVIPFVGELYSFVAVNVFFAMSGFLVMASYLRSSSTFTYAESRILRIFPGLLVCNLFGALVIGPLFTRLRLRDYLTHNQVWDFVWINSTLVFDKIQLRYMLPEVFSTNPEQGVNGSLWTLPYEVWMYISLLALGVIGTFKRSRFSSIALSTILIVLLAFPFLATGALLIRFANLQRYGLYFFAGALVYLNRQRIPLSGFLSLALCLGSIVSRGTILHAIVFPVGLIYCVFWLAYVPTGWIRQYNRVGDYSYGTYIYAFPVQQSLIAMFPGIRLPLLFGFAFVLTLFLAALSWHFVENPFLKRKGAVGRLMKRLKATRQSDRAAKLLQPD